jgi:hypothetical protein
LRRGFEETQGYPYRRAAGMRVDLTPGQKEGVCRMEQTINKLEHLSDDELEKSLMDDPAVEETQPDDEKQDNPTPEADAGGKETPEPKAEKSETDAQGSAIGEDADVSHTRQFQGLLRDAKDERAKRQELERKLADLEAKAQKAEEKPVEGEEDDGEKLLTKAELKAMLAERETQTAQQKAQQEAQNRILTSEAAAIREMTVETCGPGLDFVTVLKEGQDNLTDADRMAIAMAENPAKEAYRRCIALTPALQDRQLDWKISQRLAKKETEPGKETNPKPTTSKTTKPKGGSAATVDLQNLSDDELEALLREE